VVVKSTRAVIVAPTGFHARRVSALLPARALTSLDSGDPSWRNMSPRDMSSNDADARPLSEQVLWILVSLSRQPQHGYSLMKDVEVLSEGRIRVSTGTLYGALRRLIEEGTIEPVEGADNSRDKQTYRVTRAGRARLQTELERLQHVVRTAAIHVRRRHA
jgi:DNA-binding PadR family transcriptional regulator